MLETAHSLLQVPPMHNFKALTQTNVSAKRLSSGSTSSTSSSSSSRSHNDEDHPGPPLPHPILPLPYPATTDTHIVSSPYSQQANQLYTLTLDPHSHLFAIALTQLIPILPDYATAPYLESFNWSSVLTNLRELCAETGIEWSEDREFYAVIFRSRLRPDADRERLGKLDRKSHEEACASGGLLRYWFGEPDDSGRNLATCLWRNRADAFLGGRGPWHARARAAAREMYADISFHTHRFVIEAGAYKWRIEEVRQEGERGDGRE